MSFEWLPSVERRRDVLTAGGVISNTATKATILDPTSGTRANIVDVLIDFEAATLQNAEVFFGAGANFDVDRALGIQRASQAAAGAVLFKFDYPNEPRGAVDALVNIRLNVAIAEDVQFQIRYWES